MVDQLLSIRNGTDDGPIYSNYDSIIMWLFDSSEFFPRSHCGPGWTYTLVFISKLSNAIIFFSYLTIAFTLFYFWHKRRKALPLSYILLLFSSFILFCGFTHQCNVLVFSWPAYRFFTFVDLVTAMLSLMTATILPYVIKQVLSFPSISKLIVMTERLQEEILKRELMEVDTRKRNEQLSTKIVELERQLKSHKWLSDTSSSINDLKNILND